MDDINQQRALKPSSLEQPVTCTVGGNLLYSTRFDKYNQTLDNVRTDKYWSVLDA